MPKPPMFNPPPKQPSKIGPVTGITNRNQARGDGGGDGVGIQPGGGDSRTQAFTYFTKAPGVGEPGAAILYNGDRFWVRIRLTLETGGPVAIGTMSNIAPVLSGQGRLLITNEETEITIAKGNRLYIAATGVNRVAVVVEPLPWLEQVTGLIGAAVQWLQRIASGKNG